MNRRASSLDLKQLSSLKFEKSIAETKLACEVDSSTRLHISNALAYIQTRIKEIEELL